MGKEFDELVHDVKSHGLREAIIKFNGQILDGRNRLRACEIAKVEPSYIEFDGDDALSYVISKNLIRRHLRDSQRALIAAELATNKWGGDRRTWKPEMSRSEAAQLLRVSERSVNSAAIVKGRGSDELIEALRVGAVSVDAAARLALLPSAKQKDIVGRGSRAIVAEARKSRKNHRGSGRQQYGALWKCVDAICDALEHSQLDKAHSAASDLQSEIKRVAASRRPAK